MKYSQIDEIRNKLDKRIYQYKNGILKYPSPCYSIITEELNQKWADAFLESLERQFRIIMTFYHSHTEEPPTDKECKIGQGFLFKHNVSRLLIEWFVDSYGIAKYSE